jgi:hypothetical protein
MTLKCRTESIDQVIGYLFFYKDGCNAPEIMLLILTSLESCKEAQKDKKISNDGLKTAERTLELEAERDRVHHPLTPPD